VKQWRARRSVFGVCVSCNASWRWSGWPAGMCDVGSLRRTRGIAAGRNIELLMARVLDALRGWPGCGGGGARSIHARFSREARANVPEVQKSMVARTAKKGNNAGVPSGGAHSNPMSAARAMGEDELTQITPFSSVHGGALPARRPHRLSLQTNGQTVSQIAV